MNRVLFIEKNSSSHLRFTHIFVCIFALFLFIIFFRFNLSFRLDYHGINGNVSLDRRGEIVNHNVHNRYDLTMASDRSSSLSRSEGGVYDVGQAEIRAKENIANNNIIHGSAGGTSNGSTATNGQHYAQNGHSTLDSQTDSDSAKRKKWPTDQAYFLAKELLMTERTYKKDLDILMAWFNDELPPENVESLRPLFMLIESMIQHHSVFLRDLEHRLVLWEGRGTSDSHRIGDVMLKNMVVLPIYEEYLDNHLEYLERLNEMYDTDDTFQQIYREFEQQKICYIPIGSLLLKPLHRLLHYQLVLESE